MHFNWFWKITFQMPPAARETKTSVSDLFSQTARCAVVWIRVTGSILRSCQAYETREEAQ